MFIVYRIYNIINHDNNLCKTGLRRVLTGQQIAYKGWRKG